MNGIDALKAKFADVELQANARTMEEVVAYIEENWGAFRVKITESELMAHYKAACEFAKLVFMFKKNCRGYRGLDEYLQTELLKELPEHVRYINYTEDMGVEGLRNYKRRLAPYYLKTRYQVSVERMG